MFFVSSRSCRHGLGVMFGQKHWFKLQNNPFQQRQPSDKKQAISGNFQIQFSPKGLEFFFLLSTVSTPKYAKEHNPFEFGDVGGRWT